MPAYFRHYFFLRITWDVIFSQTKFRIGINISLVTFLQRVGIKRHSSSLTSAENLTSNLGQSVQICCREK